MQDEERLITTGFREEDSDADLSLRPHTLAEYIGQDKLKTGLNVYMQAAIARREPLDHMLLYGPPGQGKATLANVVAAEMGCNIRVINGPTIEQAGDWASLLTNLNAGDVLFVDNIHRLSHAVEELLCTAMEDNVLDIVIGKGSAAHSIRLDLPKFTLIGATPWADMLSSPLRGCFGICFCLEMYTPEELAAIVENSSKRLKVGCDRDAALEIGRHAHGMLRSAKHLTRRVRDFAEVLGNGKITLEIAREALDVLETAAGKRDEGAAGRPDGQAKG